MKSSPSLRIGELSFTNTVPFRLPAQWNPIPCPSPRLLAAWAEDDRIDAGVLPVVEAWRLEDRFDVLGPYGIAVKRKAGSVLLFSKRPWKDLEGATVGVTDQTSTSVKLLKVLLEAREGFSVQLREGFHPSDESRLVIGDDALAPQEDLIKTFPHVTDLAEKWSQWHGGPFVFARWMVRRNTPPYLRDELAEALETALDQFAKNNIHRSRQSAQFLKIPTAQMTNYFNGFVYRLGPQEERAESLFRDQVTGRKRMYC
ncbi:MAG: menaquinone biosynthesis protein [Elusimicrobia bacterium]|jgi:chorismate dehydratase|nr:menaquinone biosynthesis protein [Elusimicrobiota bacterium]